MMRVLIVEDVEDFRFLLGSMLPGMLEDLEIVEAAGGHEAIGQLKASAAFDLIICDYCMPDGNGAEVFRFLCQEGLRIPFILFSTLPSVNLEEFEGDFFLGVAPKYELERLTALVRLAEGQMKAGVLAR